MKEKERLLDKNNMTLKLKEMTQKSICKNKISGSGLVKKANLQEKGITLIALVVTIIILLILAGVTLNMALSDNGLFSKTQKAAEQYKQAQSDEEEMVRQIATQLYSEYVGVEVTGYTPTSTAEGCTVGINNTGYDTAQTLHTDANMGWRIWDFDGTTLRIIGDSTDEKIYFEGAAGYNNGVWTMDHICKELYSNDKKGVSVTNLKRSDIQKVSTYDYTQYKHKPNKAEEAQNENAGDTIQFGEVVEFDNAYYPEMWNTNDKNWNYEWNDENGTVTEDDKECITWEKIGNGEGQFGNGMLGGTTEIALKGSYYWHHYKEDEFINDKYYDLVFKDTDNHFTEIYWLANRMSHAESDEVGNFGLAAIGGHDKGGYIHGYTIYDTKGTPYEQQWKLRPIVSINLKDSGCTMTKETSTDGKVTYKLEWAQS